MAPQCHLPSSSLGARSDPAPACTAQQHQRWSCSRDANHAEHLHFFRNSQIRKFLGGAVLQNEMLLLTAEVKKCNQALFWLVVC